jgi:hypothetical protein
VQEAFTGDFESILDLVKHMSREIQNAKQQHDQIMSENTRPLVPRLVTITDSIDWFVGA